MALVHNFDSILGSHFVFCGNDIILQNGALPDEKIIRKALELHVTSDWYNEKEYDSTVIELEKNCPAPAGCEAVPLRDFFWTFRDKAEDVNKAARAKGLLNFRKNKRYCACCGGALKDDEVFTARTCVQCGKQFFPQLEPAVIINVKKDNKILLAKHKNRTKNFYSCIAGFVETGETIEETVAREVKEETGITVKNIRYTGSQAWPYPDQLMLAFCCEYESGEIKIQEDELEDACWFDMDNLPEIPPPGSVAYNLIHHRWG